MNELDMSRPGAELFQEAAPSQYNSYQDVNADQVVADPYTGVKPSFDAAGQEQLSDKEMNFRALREETSKLKAESEYWRGQAEAFKTSPRQEPVQSNHEDAYAALDWDDSRDVRKAFDTLRVENNKLRDEMKDSLSAIETKTTRPDWNNLVTQQVPQLTSQNKLFAEMIEKVSNPYEAAYLLAELNAKASGAPSPLQNQGHGQRIQNNSQKPQSLASVGGQGQLNAADYYANMSDEDFMKIAGKNLANV
jgi:hypothetical protein